ncbi:hypothetical protein [Streptomyces uncialis]|uniref:hypothetical protein n=1 Tax=Streptomyces uncialis TaxID=1048205 RepID=UPI001FE4472A|nr:hypothetical protein [Streptomyces uncialis]
MIERAHERAIAKVLEWLEDEVAEIRWASGRKRAKPPGGGGTVSPARTPWRVRVGPVTDPARDGRRNPEDPMTTTPTTHTPAEAARDSEPHGESCGGPCCRPRSPGPPLHRCRWSAHVLTLPGRLQLLFSPHECAGRSVPASEEDRGEGRSGHPRPSLAHPRPAPPGHTPPTQDAAPAAPTGHRLHPSGAAEPPRRIPGPGRPCPPGPAELLVLHPGRTRRGRGLR